MSVFVGLGVGSCVRVACMRACVLSVCLCFVVIFKSWGGKFNSFMLFVLFVFLVTHGLLEFYTTLLFYYGLGW